MKIRYRVIHQRKSIWEALFQGRTWTDWYLAQHKRWYGWKTLGTFRSQKEAEAACTDHAGGELLNNGARVVAEFTRKDEA